MNADIFARLSIAFGLLLAAAVVTPFLARKRTRAGIVNLVFVSASAALLLTVCFEAVFGHGGHAGRTISLGPVAVPLLVDGLAAIFLAIVALMGFSSALFSIRYMERFPNRSLRGYYFCFPLFLLGMACVLVVDDLALGFTLAWQIMTIPSYFLVRFEHERPETVKTARTYLVFMEFAWLLVVLGPFFAGGYRFGDSIPVLTGKLTQTGGAPLALFFGLLLAGFGLKAGVFPLGQLWLPAAYSNSPSPISALLSSAMSKTGVYGLIRAFLFMAPVGNAAFNARTWGLIVATVGAATLLIGTVQALSQSDAKRLLAFSSIGQIGYIVLAVGVALILALPSGPAVSVLAAAAVIGALYHVLNHSVFKELLFLTSGSVLYATGTKDLNKLGGLIRLMPVTAVIAFIASLSISGMPPFSGFSSKWMISTSSVLAGDSSVVLVIFGIVALFTSVVTLACYVKYFGLAFTSSGSEWNVDKTIREVPASMLAPKVILTVICLAQGLFPALSVGLIRAVLQRSEGFLLADGVAASAGPVSASLDGIRLTGLGGLPLNAAAAPLVVLLVLGLGLGLAALLRRSGGSKEIEAPTWLCGYQDLDNANRYTDRSMFAALRGLFKFAGGKSGK